MSEAAFTRHVEWLAGGAVRVVSIGELIGIDDSTDAVALTFDDGFANFGTVAAPLLRAAGLPATLFLVTDFVGGANSWPNSRGDDIPVLPLLDWPDVAAHREQGFAIGAHSRTHPHLTELSGSALRDEVNECADRIQREIGVYPDSFCYPYGSVNEEVRRQVESCFPMACTTEFRVLGPDDKAVLLPRLDMYYFREPGLLEAWGTSRFERYLKVRQQGRKLRASVRRVLGQGD